MAEDDFTAVGRPPLKDPRGPEAFHAELPRLLEEFERTHPVFRAQPLPGGVLVGRREQPDVVRALLSRSVSVEAPQPVTAADAIFKHLVGELKNRAVTAIAGVGPMPGASCPLDAVIRINKAPYIVTTFLNHVVEQAPGLVWILTYEPDAPDGGLRLGVVCPDGASFQMPLKN